MIWRETNFTYCPQFSLVGWIGHGMVIVKAITPVQGKQAWRRGSVVLSIISSLGTQKCPVKSVSR